ncbi:histidine kinase [Streptomyces sp. NBC_00378]|uniref:Sensor histidine kinase n=2 Tax=Streptomyces TaxID=1883 RepID=A0ABW2WXM3_9ACTN|nr:MULTISPECIES: histidine kinase [unclassified Streptomyces]WSG53972.1 histidine kinase [Streptomyces sp. NBC_01732]WSW04774.1 histidine kinase [Streptomyces sp. NBC_01005]WSX04603.1 histidine kinase [Streptomyces sp. NBC_00987]WTB57360.1 histidine kinase [Streptomyces sp. NBC_00826]WTC94278.1 histidine kinase [Streptomyces sp. NBC_01650]WTH89758.1 histidine kinase [Streptomyces sp. NBC_00825]WTH98485.1 histidine kinase [Streptomyces sp. NBC_00822]
MPRHDEIDPLQPAATPGRAASEPPDVAELPAPRLARIILTVALISYLGVTVINLVGTDLPTTSLLTSLGCLVLIFVLQLRHSSAAVRRAPVLQRSLTLGAQTLLTYLPIAAFHSQWGAMAGFLAGSLLLLLPSRWAWPAYGLVGLSMLIPPTLDNLSVQETVYLAQSTLLTGLVVYGLSRMAALIQALHDTRSQLAGLAVAKERLRFARDLHDLLGYSLSAITLKGELIHRLIPSNPRRALEEVSDVLIISRQSLADVRVVSSGLRSMSLEQEMRSAQSLLEAADVKVRVDIRLGTLDQRVDSVLAAVLREAVTNLLRHSRAGTCAMAATQDGDRVRLSVSNDGVDPSYRDVSPHSGSGLGNLRERLQSASGVLTITRGPGGTFELVAEAPARPPRRFADPDDAEFGAQDHAA